MANQQLVSLSLSFIIVLQKKYIFKQTPKIADPGLFSGFRRTETGPERNRHEALFHFSLEDRPTEDRSYPAAARKARLRDLPCLNSVYSSGLMQSLSFSLWSNRLDPSVVAGSFYRGLCQGPTIFRTVSHVYI